MKSTVITLVDKNDTYNFRQGMPLRMTESGELVPMSKLRILWLRITAPFRKRVVVTAIDVESGTITVDNAPKWYRFL